MRAQFYDPLSGQGISKAITTALHAAEAIAADLLRDRAAIDNFVKAADRQYEAYLATRSAHYRREQRWPHQVFWKRRGSGSVPVPSR